MVKTDRKFKIWKCYDNKDTLLDQSKVLEVIGITRNGSLVINYKNNKSKEKFWVKKDFFETSDAPPFKFTCNENWGLIIREMPSDKDFQFAIAYITKEFQNNN